MSIRIHTAALFGLLLVILASLLIFNVTQLEVDLSVSTSLILMSAAGVFTGIAWYTHRRTRNQSRHWKRYADKLNNILAMESSYGRVMSSINDLLQVFGRTRDLDSVLEEAIETLDAVLQVDVLVLQLYSTEDSRFFRRIERGDTDVDLGDRLKEDLMEKHRSRLMNNLPAEKRYQCLGDQGFVSLTAVPMLRTLPDGRMEAIGFIAALNRHRDNFSSRDLDLLSLFARAAGLIIENAHLYEKTRRMAMRDDLTNLVNRRRFADTLSVELENARTQSNPLSFIMADIDHFKHYNDTHGHQQGDKALRAVADVLLANTRGGDTVARYGGEEFAIILPNTDIRGAQAVGEKIRDSVARLDLHGVEEQPEGALTMTLGIAHFPGDAQHKKHLIDIADQALYYGKCHGRNTVVTAREIDPDWTMGREKE
ncbi:MAG: diguanylate cyclase [Planctomycetota bacterium]